MASGVFLLLERVDADHQPGDAVVLVELDDLVGEPDRLLDVALGQHRQEGALQKLGILRVAAQRGAVIGGGRAGVALGAGVARGEIAAGRASGAPAHALTADRWRSARACAAPWAESVAGKSNVAAPSTTPVRRRNGVGTITSGCLHGRRCASPSSRAQNGLFAVLPQGEECQAAAPPTKRIAVWRYRDRCRGTAITYWNISARRRPPGGTQVMLRLGSLMSQVLQWTQFCALITKRGWPPSSTHS